MTEGNSIVSRLAGSLRAWPAGPPSADRVRAAAAWVLEVLRNLLLVAALQYAAERANSTILQVVSIVAGLAFWAYVVSYMNPWAVHLFGDRGHRLKFLLDGVLAIAIAIVLFVALPRAVIALVDAIAHAQGSAATRIVPAPGAP